MLWIDSETYNETPITNGTHAYAATAEVMLVTYAIDNGPVQCWDLTETGFNRQDMTPMPGDLFHKLIEIARGEDCICAHNSSFDRNVFKHFMHLDLPLPQWRDTMVQALAHSLPGSLGALCEVLRIPTDKAKDKEGKRLIQLFCKPRPKNMKLRRATRLTHPQEWEAFKQYAKLDIDAMREVARRLPTWNYHGDELALWQLDQRINDRGFLVDLDLARAAVEAVDEEQVHLAKRTREMTNNEVQAATQRDALLRHTLAEYGVALPDMAASTLERRINDPDLPDGLRELLSVRLQASTTSTSKYKTLIKATSADGRLRGTLQFCGASRTGRWAGRTFQPQNLPRPSLKQKDIDFGIAALKDGCADLVCPDVMQLTSSAIRGCIIAPPGKKITVADLSNIEGRMLAWLADEAWKLQAFRDFDAGTGHDLYALAYAKAFGITPDEVMENKKTGDGSMRQVGKVMELALGYQGGVGAFLTFAAAYRIELEELAETAWPSIPKEIKERVASTLEWTKKQKRNTFGLSDKAFMVCDAFKVMWRNAHPNIVAWWTELEDACRIAITRRVAVTCRHVVVDMAGAWLRIKLPSGRFLCYPSPRVEDDGKLSYMGVNQYSRKWGRLGTYGGKLAENITQAAARDVLAGNMPAIEAAGYQIILSVHDENLTETPDTPEYSHEKLAALMARCPDWALDLPLAAAGFEAYRYKKD